MPERTGYTETLAAARRKPALQQTDAEAMAEFCHHNIQILLGAVSPQLIWEGAQAKGMTLPELLALIHNNKPAAIDLMWLPRAA